MSRTTMALVLGLLVLLGGCANVYGNDEPALAFQEVADDVGFDYRGAPSRTMNSGAGVYVSDYDGDGWPDVLALGGRPDGGEPGPVLYHNEEGVFERSGALPGAVLREKNFQGALFFDYDNDGDDDLLLLAIESEPTFLENRNASFVVRDVGFDRALDVPLGAAAADYDGDGRLDVAIYQNGNWQTETPAGYQRAGEEITQDNGNPNYLYRWNGSGFERATDAGLSGTRWTLGASFVDLTGDGYPDLHFTNDYNNDVVYVNQRDGTFARVPTGTATNRNGMASEVADVTGDGRPDVFVTNMFFNESKVTGRYAVNYLRNVLGKRAKGNNLLANAGNGTLVDRARALGLRRGGWGWAAVAGDLDNDGDTDVVHATQEFTDTFLRETFGTSDVPSFYSYPAVFERTGDEYARRDASTLGFEQANGRGMARLDYDRDGDLDLLVAQWSEGDYKLYENTGASGNWIELTLRGERGQTPLGATVTVTAGDETWTRYYNSRADYQSQDSRTVHVGLGDHGTVTEIRIEWPDGSTTVLRDVEPNARIVVGIDGTTKRAEAE